LVKQTGDYTVGYKTSDIGLKGYYRNTG